jgi:hypothetical protein
MIKGKEKEKARKRNRERKEGREGLWILADFNFEGELERVGSGDSKVLNERLEFCYVEE